MTYQKKLPLFKYYRKIETESGYILYSLYPFGNFTFDYSLDRKTYKFGLTGSLIFKDFTNDNGEYKDNFTQLKAIESDGKFTLLVKKYCSENYEDYWEGEVDLLGDWNNIDRVLTTNTIINDNTSLVENNKDVEYNIFSF
ncbi:MAG: hypothetical protein GY870_09640, partial [archaeon]|nr:hypothetical protein [archaeon]